MEKICATLKGFACLLLVVWMSACNKDGIETIVIEDGQLSAAQMIIGSWRPNGGEIADPETGEVIERLSPDDIPWMDIFGDGTGDLHKGGSSSGGNTSGGAFDWNVDEGDLPSPGVGEGDMYDGNGPSFDIGDYHWYIFQLTDGVLIIYRYYGDNIIIYYYGRISDYDEPDDLPDLEPAAKNRITEICQTTTYGGTASASVVVYSFSYDNRNRIQGYRIASNRYTYEWTYSYDGQDFYVDGYESFRGVLNDDGYITQLYFNQSPSLTKVTYTREGYLKAINDYALEYEGNNLLSVSGSGMTYSFEYSEVENDANIDLNCIISDCSRYEYDYSHGSLFAPFRFYGKSSQHMISKEICPQGWDYDYEYAYKEDEKGRVIFIERYQVARSGLVFQPVTYEITYAD